MCQGFSHFSGILHNFVLAKLVTSSIRINKINLTGNSNLKVSTKVIHCSLKYCENSKFQTKEKLFIRLTCKPLIPNYQSQKHASLNRLRPKKEKLFVSKIPTLKLFIPPNPNKHKTCINHTFFEKKNQKYFFAYFPTINFFRLLQETNNYLVL